MRTIALLSGLALVGLTGCENAAESMAESMVEAASGGEVEIDRDGKKVRIKTDEGEVTTEVNEDGETARAVVTGPDGEKATFTSGKEVPADFPLPILEGAEVMSSTQMKQNGGAMYNVTIKTDQEPAQAADFYVEALKAKGLKTKRNELETDENLTIMVNGQSKTHQVMVNAARKGGDEKTTVLLHWVNK